MKILAVEFSYWQLLCFDYITHRSSVKTELLVFQVRDLSVALSPILRVRNHLCAPWPAEKQWHCSKHCCRICSCFSWNRLSLVQILLRVQNALLCKNSLVALRPCIQWMSALLLVEVKNYTREKISTGLAGMRKWELDERVAILKRKKSWLYPQKSFPLHSSTWSPASTS